MTASTTNFHIYRWWNNPPPEEVRRDNEALLKYELSLISSAYQDECAPIIKQLADIEMMKPPKPFCINIDSLTAEQKEHFMAMAKRTEP